MRGVSGSQAGLLFFKFMTYKIALGLQYDGSHFHGWQTQPHGHTVQDVVERALTAFCGRPVATLVAGRTDTGVHALGQVIHLETELDRAEFSWVRGVNAFLPEHVAVQWACRVPETFHARFSAKERTYFYALYAGPVRPPLLHGRAGYVMLPPGQHLDTEAMQEAAQYLLGEHDFSAFRAANCQAKSPRKNMYEIRLVPRGNWLFIKFRANAFLYHMVRNIMGCLIAVGRGRQRASWMQQVLAGGDRTLAAPTFMSDGLYLADVSYPEYFALPASSWEASWFDGVWQ